MTRMTSRRRSERAHGYTVGVARTGRRSMLAPPEPTGDRVSCPVCRNAVKPTGRGFLRAHNDLFGHPCYNRRPPEETTDV